MSWADTPRVIVEGLAPAVDQGAFPVKRTVGETVVVEADAFTDGHDQVAVMVLHRHASEEPWRVVRMTSIHNDRFRASFRVEKLGLHHWCVSACIDRFATWRHGLEKKHEAGVDVANELLAGADLVEALVAHDPALAKRLAGVVKSLRDPRRTDRVAVALDPTLRATMDEVVLTTPLLPRTDSAEQRIRVDRERARFSAWYEFFPRSTSDRPGAHGTLRDAEKMLEYVADMGFDVVYLPPIHPIGTTKRKGKNNALVAQKDDVGSPWAIGNGAEGGHKAIHPELGTFADFARFVKKAAALGIDIAMDVALQCSPDHPYVKEHPEWFRWRADGTVQHAENPPKKYEDVLPFEFECEDREALWTELRSIFLFWVAKGVTVFRVDNPHTKPLPFWEWCIDSVLAEHPEVIFLAEAFTRPKVMYRLAKSGFTQSYTYFAWRNTKWEITQYLEEITRPPLADCFRGNLWPNTPDILTEHLQHGGRGAFLGRAVLAATLGASWGIYGPAYELCEGRGLKPGSEEYLDSEKYAVTVWDKGRADSLCAFLGRLNRIRREQSALQADRSLRFHPTDNDHLLCYSKRSEDGACIVLTVVNLDPHHRHRGHVEVPIHEFGLPQDRPYQVHDLLTDARYLWHGSRNYVELDATVVPAHVFRIRRFVRRENEFDYYE